MSEDDNNVEQVRRDGKWFTLSIALMLVAFGGVQFLMPQKAAKQTPVVEEPVALPEPPPFRNSTFAQVDGVRVHYRYFPPSEYASGTYGNVVFVHGFCESTVAWYRQFYAFTNMGYRVAAVDVPPFGYSGQGPEVENTDAARAKYVWGALTDLAKENGFYPAEPWVLVGHSTGCNVITAMAAADPSRVEGLVYVAGGSRRGYVVSDPSLKARNQDTDLNMTPIDHWLGAFGRSGEFNMENVRAVLVSARGEDPSDEVVKGYLEPLQRPGVKEAIIDKKFDLTTEKFSDLPSLEIPVMFIWGSEDRWAPMDLGERMHLAHVGSEFAVVKRAGHHVMQTHVREFNDRLSSFLWRFKPEEEFQKMREYILYDAL